MSRTERRWPRKEAIHNLVYVSFAVLGLFALIVATFFAIAFDDSGDTQYTTLIFMTFILGIPFAIAILLGPCLSVFFWRDTSLMLLLVATAIVYMMLSTTSLQHWQWILFPYGALCLWSGVQRTKSVRSVKDRPRP